MPSAASIASICVWRPGTDVDAFAPRARKHAAAGVLAIAPQVERDRAVTVTRAYRVNLNMLALVALFTGAFLVFSTQSLSVLRRRRSLALVARAGGDQSQLRRALLGEGWRSALVGLPHGRALGALIAAAILRFLTADLGNGQLRAAGASLHAARCHCWHSFDRNLGGRRRRLGAGPQRRTPAAGARSKGRRWRLSARCRTGWRSGVALLLLGAVLAWLPPIAVCRFSATRRSRRCCWARCCWCPPSR